MQEQRAKDLLGPAIFPVYRFDDDESADPVHVGTCFAIDYAQRRFLVTAAHVRDHQTTGKGELGFGTRGGEPPFFVSGTWHVADRGDKSREDDPLDFAWCELTAEERADVSAIDVTLLEDAPRSTQEPRVLTMIGFPVSKNKKLAQENRRKGQIRPNKAQYSNTETVPDDYFSARGMSASTHVAMKRQPRSMEGGTEVNTIGHRGFSGGPIIDLAGTGSPRSPGDPTVVGIVLEGDEKSQIIVALRIAVVLRDIDSYSVTPP